MKRSHLNLVRKNGFSLVVTVAMLVVLTVIAVGLLSLSAISLKSSAISSAEERARSNARMALMMAIDRLQAQLGRDERITANAAILSTSSVANPYWLGVWDSWRAGNDAPDRPLPDANSEHTTIYQGGRGDPIPASLHPAYETNRESHFREWLVSLDDTAAANLQSGRTLNLDATYMPNETQDAVILVGEGTLGEGIPDAELVKASLVPVDTTASGATTTGRYGWWVGDESQKGSIIDDPYVNDTNLTDADRVFRAQAPGSMGTAAVEELANLTPLGNDQLDSVSSRLSMDLLDGSVRTPAPGGTSNGPSAKFHDLTTFSQGVLADVREGGLKKDLSTLLERRIVPLEDETGASDINDFMLYRFTAKNGLMGTSELQEIVPIQDIAAYYQMYDGTSSTAAAKDPDRVSRSRGMVYNSSYISNGPHILSCDFGRYNTDPVYLREYTGLYRQPRILKMQFVLSLFAEEVPNWDQYANRFNPRSTLNSHELLMGITPAITLWNPANVPVMMQMNSNPRYVTQMMRFHDLPLQIRIRKNPGAGEVLTNYMSVQQLTGVNDGICSLYWSGLHSVFLEPGEIKTFSLPYIGDLSTLKSQMGYTGHWAQGWAMSSFFMKTDAYFEGHEVREGWDPDAFILMNNSASGPAGAPAPLVGQPDLRDIVGSRLRFKRTDDLQLEVNCNRGGSIAGFMSNQANYHDFGTSPHWDRTNYSLSTRGRASAAFNEAIFRRGMTNGQNTLLAPSRSGAAIIARTGPTPTDTAGWPFLQYSLMADCETNDAVNTRSGGGRKLPGRPFLHSSVLHASPFLADNSGVEFYNFPYNWSADLINSSFEAPVQVNAGGQSFYGGGYTSEYGTTHVIQQEIPVVPPISLAALSHARLGGFSVCRQEAQPYGGAESMGNDGSQYRRHLWTRAVGYGGLAPHTLQAIGNSYAYPFIPADRAHTTLVRNMNENMPDATVTLADHSYLANKALYDDYFFSSITPQPSAVQVFGSSDTDAQTVAENFFFDGEPLPNRRLLPYTSGLDTDRLDTLFGEYDTFQGGLADKIASYLMVEGSFNVNSTSVEAWKVLFSSLKGKPVAYLDPSGSMSGADPNEADSHSGTPVGQTGLAGGPTFRGSPDDPRDADQWTGWRELTDDEIEELAEAMVEQVKLRGPFLSLSEFVNRRLDSSEPELSAKGALQAALDDPDVSINEAFRTTDRRFSNAEIADMNPTFREAAEGAIAYGSSAYVDQADILRNFAAQLTPRGDTFVVRAYGDSIDAAGNVEARAWCEAVVQRLPEYVDPAFDSGDIGDRPETKSADLTSDSNRLFGRKMQITSFRWLNPTEV